MATYPSKLFTLPEALANRYQGPAILPTYDRSAISPGIVHLGVGGFHRAHQAVYLDRLLSEGGSRLWGISGVGILDRDRAMKDALVPQDCLYVVVEKGPNGDNEARVVGSMVDYKLVADDADAVIGRLTAPETHIVTLTITEGGYNLKPATGEFDEENPTVLAELAGQGSPRTHFRLLHDALKRRHASGLPAFTVASCDNIRGNGAVARRTLMRYAELEGSKLAPWIEDNVAFPNSMVDRITPVTEDADRGSVANAFGLRDAWPVMCESFSQWVLEDDFPHGRPALEDVGVQFVSNVLPYELMKLRLLNASHQVLGALGFLAGKKYVDEAMADPQIWSTIADFQEREAQPTLPPVPGMDLASYRYTLLQRFANPSIKDTIARMCIETSTMMPNFLLPIICDQIGAGRDASRSIATVAAWALRCEEPGAYKIVDRRRDSLVARARNTSNPFAFIDDHQIFGELSANQHFRAQFLLWRDKLRSVRIGGVLTELSQR